MKELKNKIIKEIWIDEQNQYYLKFICEDGVYCYEATGDCCSESYFSDVNRLGYFINEKINEVKEVELMEEEYQEKTSRQEYDSIYGVKIYTDKGIGLIIMRNSSNGYYGGSYNLVNEDEISSKIKMIKIENDYSSSENY